MDPEACLRNFYDALASVEYDDAVECHANLLEWLAKGGFEPKWSRYATSREAFAAWSLPDDE
jgi:hypothetical protein